MTQIVSHLHTIDRQNNNGRDNHKYTNAIAVGDSNDTLQLTPNVRCAAATIQPMEIDDFTNNRTKMEQPTE
jgi:hypothetical protein